MHARWPAEHARVEKLADPSLAVFRMLAANTCLSANPYQRSSFKCMPVRRNSEGIARLCDPQWFACVSRGRKLTNMFISHSMSNPATKPNQNISKFQTKSKHQAMKLIYQPIQKPFQTKPYQGGEDMFGPIYIKPYKIIPWGKHVFGPILVSPSCEEGRENEGPVPGEVKF